MTGDYYYDVLEDGEISVYSYKGTETVLHIPETIDGYTVTVVGSNILMENDTVEEVVIPDTCKSIGSAAFFRCSSLEEYIDLCECSCGKIFTKDEYEKHKKDGEDAYSAAQASETIDEYMNGPYGKCGTVSEVTKKTEASNVEYKAAKIITKKAWTEKLSYKSPSYTRYGALKSGGLKNSKYVRNAEK
ncbi:MAG: leucine-rich repeat domain-containing protein [Lachnospiraceae bacterium]|nr:leucine-rich repeat domain-containing protein [Lachnospiraceae bacterium]